MTTTGDAAALAEFLAGNIDDHGGNEDLVIFLVAGGEVALVEDGGLSLGATGGADLRTGDDVANGLDSLQVGPLDLEAVEQHVADDTEHKGVVQDADTLLGNHESPVGHVDLAGAFLLLAFFHYIIRRDR